MGISSRLSLIAAVLAVAGIGASSAQAAEPWWHLVSSARPTYLHRLAVTPPPTRGQSEVQELVSDTRTAFELKVEGNSVGIFEDNRDFGAPLATAPAIQAALASVYGAGNVAVKGTGPEELPPLTVTSVGADAEKPVAPIDLGVVASEGGGTASVAVRTTGQAGHPGAEGVLVATVANLGDLEARECIKVRAGAGGFKDSECTEAASPAGTGEFESTLRIVDKLPAGLEAVTAVVGEDGTGGYPFHAQECVHESQIVECTASGLLPYHVLEVRIGVVVDGRARVPGRGEPVNRSESNEISVSGGGAPPASISRPVTFSEDPTPFGVEEYELSPEEEGGQPDTQAGSHPFQTTFEVALNEAEQTVSGDGSGSADPAGDTKDVHDNFPPGMIGNPQPFARCTSRQFLAKVNECPVASVVGVAVVTISEPGHLGTITFTVPVFNLEPAYGEPAHFGFLPLNNETPVYIDAGIRTGEDYGITVHVNNIPQTVRFISNLITIWGVPGDPRHNTTRDGCVFGPPNEVAESGYPCVPFEESFPPAFFELPTSCPGVAMRSSIEADSWEHPGDFATGENIATTEAEPMPTLDGCDKLPFSPSLEVKPDVPDGSTSTGLAVNVKVPQEASLSAKGLGEADIRNTTVTLPEGVQINPAGGDGLEGCSDALIGFQAGRGSGGFEEPPLEPGVSLPLFTSSLPGSVGAVEPLEPGVNFCSNASKIATARVRTPILGHDLEGAVYLAPQEANPFGSLVAMYIVVEDAEAGVLLKLPGEVSLDPVTGRIVTTFLNTPQAPAEEIELHFFGGERAPLATPARCGTYTTTTSIVPWSAPGSGAPSTPSAGFPITSGPNGSGCPGASLPFHPTLTAGTTSIQAGGFSPFTMTMSREDGEQHLQAVELKMPPGLSGTLAGVELCPEPQADEGTCGPNSLIGETTVSVGVGGAPFSVKGGRVYITGPYEGAPFGLSIVNPAKAGPYDLEDTKASHPACDCVLVRAKIEVNPITAALTVTSDDTGPYKIPTIIEGIPLQIQHVNVTINRPGFIFNPTDCDKLEISGTLSSTEGSTQPLSVPFQATNCAALAFKPQLTASTTGKTSRANGASFTVKLGYPAGPYDANIAKVKVELPKAMPSRLTTLQKACLATIFETNPAACPPASIVGHATARTPVLPVPLSGPAYFVSHGGEAFPSLVIVLQGYGVTVHIVGSTFINKAGITSSTFKAVPDVPVGTFELTLPEGPFSALAANGNFCKKKLAMPTEFVGQNGALIKTSTKIAVTGCPKAKPKAKRVSHKKKGRKGKRRK